MTEPRIVDHEIINKVRGSETHKHNHVSLETLTLLVNTSRLKDLHEKTDRELKELTERQGHVRSLQSLLKKMNMAQLDDGSLEISDKQEIQKLLMKAQEIGVDMKEQRHYYSKEEKERLIENIRMTMDDLNSRNDMQLQKINRITNERYESYQLARTILKPLHEAKMQSARAAKA